MIAGISSLVFVPLLAVSLVHFLWAFGSNWPVNDQKTLARTVAGFKGIDHMPPRTVSASVAIAILFAGIWALFMSDPAPNHWLTLGGGAFALVFLGRGIAGFTKKWRALTPEEPFATFDRKLYSPLCLGVGTGFLLLTIWRLV